MQNAETRPIGIVASGVFALLAAAAALLMAQPAAAAPQTYTVTSTQCDGPGSIREAMTMANSNVGFVDTIEIAAGLQIQALTCDGEPDPSEFFVVHATESVIIEGNGAKLFGLIQWITTDGLITPTPGSRCIQKSDIIIAESPGFILVGQFGEDNSDITVTVRDLDLEELNAVARIEEKASLIMEDLDVFKIIPGYKASRGGLPAVDAQDGANFTARDTSWNNIYSCRRPPDPEFSSIYEGAAFTGGPGSVGGEGAGNLTLENSFFQNIIGAGAIFWNGKPGSEVNIVSSRFDSTGGFSVLGDATTNIVNTIWSTTNPPDITDTMYNVSSAEMNIVASTILWPFNRCDLDCNAGDKKGMIYRWPGAGKINLRQSAIGLGFPDVLDDRKMLDPSSAGPNPGFSADAYTFVQPVPPAQDADALRLVTDQPSLITGSPALGTGTAVDTQATWATPVFPGVLIDMIENADCGEANALINPIDRTTCITEDALGNPRVDANGDRDIGAVQLGLAPNLSLAGTGDGSVDLKWIEPLHHNGLPILGYEIEYFETGSGVSTIIPVDPTALSETLVGLTNGTEYGFEVRAIYSGPSGAETGPFSNLVTATPYAGIATPVVTATPGDREVALSWPLPDLGGRTFEFFTIQWRIAGTTDYTDALVVSNPGTTTTTITGLKNGTTYEFAVVVKASGEVSEPGLATATPHGDIGTVNRSPDQSLAANNKANNPKYWEREPYSFGDCTKYEYADGFGSVLELLDDASALILKSDGIDDLWVDPRAGLYGTASAKDISHVIVCVHQQP